MVNNIIDTYSDSNEVQIKETRIQFQIRSNEQQNNKTEFRTIRLIDSKDQLNSIENKHDAVQIKRTKLNDDNKLFEFLNNKDHLVESSNQSVLSNYLANEVNENQFLNCVNTNLENELPNSSSALIDEFDNSIEINESFNDNKIICDNQLNDTTFNQTTLQNDPFLSFLPYHFSISSDKSINSNLTNQPSSTINLSKILLSNQDINKPVVDHFKTDLRTNTLDNQTDLFQFNNHSSSRSNSPSDYIKLDSQDNEQIAIKINQCSHDSIGNSINSSINNSINNSINSSINGSIMNSSSSSINSSSIDPTINEKRSLSSQKLNGEDLLFSLTSEDLNDVANYFSLLNSELKDKSNFNCSPSLDSLNSGDSMFCSSSVWDSPPPSSNSSLNNDLDMPFILSSDSNDLSNNQNNEQSLLDSEFPFLSEDSMFNSFINSNLNDLIDTDEFFDEKLSDLQFENNLNSFLNCSTNSFSSINDHHHTNSLSSKTKKHCNLSKDSNLAKLLREKLPIKLPSQSNQKADQSNNQLVNNNLKTKDDLSSTNNVNNNVNNNLGISPLTTNLTGNSKDVDLKKNGLITRKFTIQGLNMNNNKAINKTTTTTAVSTGCLARSIKIIDPLGMQVATTNGNNVKYLLNNFTPQNATNQTGNGSFSLNLSTANCLTVTTNGTSTTSLNNSSSNSINNNQSNNMSATKSFIIKSVDGKFANGILYTPISRNGTNITYTSNLNANTLNNLNNTSSTNSTNGNNQITTDKTKIMAAFTTPNTLFINNRSKLVQKRPYSSMSVSISNNSNNSQPKDFYSIDLVPKQLMNNDPTFGSSSNDQSITEIKKIKTSFDSNVPSTSANKNYSSKF